MARARLSAPSFSNTCTRWVFNGGLGHEQGLRDLAVGCPRVEQSEHLQLAVGQAHPRCAHDLHDACAQLGSEHESARSRLPDRAHDVVGGDVFEQVAGRPRLDSAQDLGVAVERRQDQHGGGRLLRTQRGGRLHPVHAVAQPQVAQHDVGTQMPREGHRLLAGRRRHRPLSTSSRWSNSERTPARTMGWSSTSSTRTAVILHPPVAVPEQCRPGGCAPRARCRHPGRSPTSSPPPSSRRRARIDRSPVAAAPTAHPALRIPVPGVESAPVIDDVEPHGVAGIGEGDHDPGGRRVERTFARADCAVRSRATSASMPSEAGRRRRAASPRYRSRRPGVRASGPGRRRARWIPARPASARSRCAAHAAIPSVARAPICSRARVRWAGSSASRADAPASRSTIRSGRPCRGCRATPWCARRSRRTRADCGELVLQRGHLLLGRDERGDQPTPLPPVTDELEVSADIPSAKMPPTRGPITFA